MTKAEKKNFIDNENKTNAQKTVHSAASDPSTVDISAPSLTDAAKANEAGKSSSTLSTSTEDKNLQGLLEEAEQAMAQAANIQAHYKNLGHRLQEAVQKAHKSAVTSAQSTGSNKGKSARPARPSQDRGRQAADTASVNKMLQR
jgi:molecular chaperone GrpE (heat shock protein)